ncbi:cytochrome c biogenesis CcdA family protein [Haloarcula nitratireducens]|uniref:Integral membrane transporter n=1 Tax=Haloarcula nitratireducens TaxID=2487749 RepID=A0AAW4PII2_9EURY|nr:integral membrane transporter [Halomicroarcula nitratireducens]MBX0297614.1 integral membrane transporter [Halomicroarcula nitratireducens]
MALFSSPSLLAAAYAAGVLMFFAPCSVGLLPAYLSYFYTHDSSQTDQTEDVERGPLRTVVLVHGIVVFLVGAIPLFYMAVAGIRVLLPGYKLIVPLAKLGTGSYLPPVAVVVIGTVLMLLALGQRAVRDGLRVGGFVTLGVIAVYLLIGAVVLGIGHWIKPYLVSMELLVGPLLIGVGIMYYYDISPIRSARLPERGATTIPAFVGFGIVYGIGSLACNLPVFLGMVLTSFTTAGFVEGLAVFGAFAAGMGTLVLGVSVAARVTGNTVSLGQYGRPARLVGSTAFVIIGIYVTWYSLRSFRHLPASGFVG